MKLVVIVLLEPQPEGLIEFVKGDALLESGEKTLPDGPEEALDFSARGTVIGFGMDEGDAGHGAASSQKLGGETGPVIDIESFGKPVGEESFFKDEGQGADGLRGAEGMTHHHAGMIVEDSAKDGFVGAFAMIVGLYGGSVHKVTNPQVVDVVHFIGLSHIGAGLDCQKPLLFDDAKRYEAGRSLTI